MPGIHDLCRRRNRRFPQSVFFHCLAKRWSQLLHAPGSFDKAGIQTAIAVQSRYIANTCAVIHREVPADENFPVSLHGDSQYFVIRADACGGKASVQAPEVGFVVGGVNVDVAGLGHPIRAKKTAAMMRNVISWLLILFSYWTF